MLTAELAMTQDEPDIQRTELKLIPQERARLVAVARRHGVSLGAARAVLTALVEGDGKVATFDHVELGGAGQWMADGPTIVSDLFNTELKERIQILCDELSTLLEEGLIRPGATDGDHVARQASPKSSLYTLGRTKSSSSKVQAPSKGASPRSVAFYRLMNQNRPDEVTTDREDNQQDLVAEMADSENLSAPVSDFSEATSPERDFDIGSQDLPSLEEAMSVVRDMVQEARGEDPAPAPAPSVANEHAAPETGIYQIADLQNVKLVEDVRPSAGASSGEPPHYGEDTLIGRKFSIISDDGDGVLCALLKLQSDGTIDSETALALKFWERSESLVSLFDRRGRQRAQFFTSERLSGDAIPGVYGADSKKCRLVPIQEDISDLDVQPVVCRALQFQLALTQRPWALTDGHGGSIAEVRLNDDGSVQCVPERREHRWYIEQGMTLVMALENGRPTLRFERIMHDGIVWEYQGHTLDSAQSKVSLISSASFNPPAD